MAVGAVSLFLKDEHPFLTGFEHLRDVGANWKSLKQYFSIGSYGKGDFWLSDGIR